jgi:hypothetical protein
MARMFETEVRAALVGAPVPSELGAHRGGFFAWVDGAPADGYRAPRSSLSVCERGQDSEAVLLTGEYGIQVLAPLLPELSEAAGAPVRALPVPNRLFGGNIAVTGLIAGADAAAVLAEQPDDGRRYLLPDVTLSRGVFLDGSSPAELPRPVEVVATDGRALVAALRP